MSIKDRLPVKGFIETSFIDWKGYLSSVLFTGGCNFRCPYCHNPDLVLNPDTLEDVPHGYIFSTLRKYKVWVERVVITGGEPTIHKNLKNFIKRLKKEGFLIKLDTNGSNPYVLKDLVEDKLIDYVAMDVKGPIDRYSRWCGVEIDTERIRESINFLLEGHVDYEFRMTVVPFLHQEEDVYDVAQDIKNAERFNIQDFKSIKNILDNTYSSVKPFPEEMMKRIRRKATEIVKGNTDPALKIEGE
ncbi:MAG: anaerobic ribonucleoside-triphosphate reductase activating protein [Syntrophorhabdaceae bacterium]|nr:anaerobic ribonucleoside-triphosphate reductase activating protein [Syntrophorhabdaceae bacterium]